MRFQGYETAWEKNSVGEVISIKSDKYNPDIDESEYPCIELESLSQGTGELLSTFSSKNQKSIKNVFHSGNVLFGKLRPYLRKFYLSDFNGVCSSEIWVMSSLTFNPSYLYSYIQSNRFLSLTEITSGSKMPRADWNLISTSIIRYPLEHEEREKIGELFRLLNNRIQTQSKIIQHLESSIKGFSQKLFSQQLRFKDENGNDFGDWEYNNGNLLFTSISDKKHNSDLPILAITQDKGAIPRDLIDYSIGVTAKSISSYKVVQKGDFIISLRSFQGGIEYSNYKGICSPAYIILRPIKNMNRVFYKYYLKTTTYIIELNRKLEGIRDGKMISYKYFSEIELPYPSFEEQTKIANFLSSLDAKLEKEKQLLEQYQQQKKFLLQNLFI
ncbi:restriction endonuclease subunit S [Galbibacter mesophilus]|uniref:restriction endonuclease subunit S n=1 Tax=Galbibacter mesophilus TaxID=379069 RepID=UPI00191FC3FC|nr:restriction endonuclease subunit S [Galbibacter mesophilus]MCM5661823.1 restriction endonuclease subunit S [Galbibacter mesophilus]